jgi:hypothetical protein
MDELQGQIDERQIEGDDCPESEVSAVGAMGTFGGPPCCPIDGHLLPTTTTQMPKWST